MKSAIAAAVVLLALPAGAAAGPMADKVRAGEALYARCMGCHALAYDRTGPRHCGLIGRRAGSVPAFPYSDAMKASDIVWTAQALDRFLNNPLAALPGTSMGYAGVADPAERAALIAFLKHADSRPECREINGKR